MVLIPSSCALAKDKGFENICHVLTPIGVRCKLAARDCLQRGRDNRKIENRQHTNTRRESRAKPRTISPPTTKSKLLLGVFRTCHASAPDTAKVG
jgi:hypothetical protein